MNVIVITNGFQHDYVTNFANNLIKNVDKVCLVIGDHFPIEKLDSRINFINLRGSHKENVPFSQKFVRILKYYYRLIKFTLKSDIRRIHYIWIRFSVLEGILLPSIFRMFGKRTIYTVHDVVPHDRDNKLNRLIFRIVYNIHNNLVVHTEYIKNRLIKEFGINEFKIHIFKHGVYEITDSQEISNLFARKEYGITNSEFVVLFYGVIAKYKGLDFLIKTFEKLEHKYPGRIRLIAAGKVHPNYTDAFENFEKTISSPNISIFKGYQDDKTTEKLFKTADVTVLPYFEASQSGVMFLSYAYGVPVIAPYLGGFPYDILNGKTGFLFEKGDQKSLMDAIIKIIEGPKMGIMFTRDEIKKFAAENYSWDMECKKLVDSCFQVQ